MFRVESPKNVKFQRKLEQKIKISSNGDNQLRLDQIRSKSVSYTHLDVYKRQVKHCINL